ncbi:hypothetical protein Q3A66_15795 [Hymenobacter sp. BT770]|uniref:hypothetical protein n=1 Tax=Hymenobacter sp. BT770 TaxID=2886942 RepID=UPI001D0FEEE9|nr:hypothetical protein [Hymenobacter sp. BT770]MCC3154753.1 hypothetical protein [Hymenobacter sp. BT770]MDO3416532.1 hypothetical protein [Hymenobacter sp. BT770]
MRSGILLLVVILALGALAALLWWRFKGSGKPAAPVAVLATHNHHSLRSFHYGTAATAKPAGKAAAATEVGEALARLLPREDLPAPEPAHAAEEEQAALPAASPQPAIEEPAEVGPEAPAEEAPRPASIRHAAGALASLLDAQEDAAAPAPTPEPLPEADEEPAEALFHNPITAPAPTPNDQANRAAEIALRQQRRARMCTDASAQRAALSGLFPGAGSPIPTAQPS